MKRICAMILALVLTLCGCTSTVVAADNGTNPTDAVLSIKAEGRFSDVPENAYYAEAVEWAVAQGVTVGTGASTFSPDATCTRAQIVTFLYRAAGSHAAGDSTHEIPFVDVPADAYYADAVRWAVETGVTVGTGADTFSPGASCTRAQIVTFLYRNADSPAVGDGAPNAPFSDVPAGAYYADAVQWAVAQGVTIGTSADTFSPNATCTRAEAVTFLYRAATPEHTEPESTEPIQTEPEEEPTMRMKINDTTVTVLWEDNESVAALMALVQEAPLVISMSMYGGFEQVGPIGQSLPRNDVQTVTESGDIVLYSGNQIVVFYGSNSWAYTRLGHITDQDAAGMAALLGNGNVTITISMEVG